jgi:glycosyltransferase involved in cell wall biosynthesis
VVEWQEPAGLGRMERFNSLLKPGYVPFFVRARRWANRALESGEHFDVAHQLTPVAMRYPSPLATLGIPYLIGPVGGSLPSPSGFASDGDTAPWYVSLRSIDALRMRRDPMLRRTYENASCVLGIAPYVRDLLGDLDVRRFEVLSETAIDRLPTRVEKRASIGPLKLLYVGRIVRTKGLRDAITALSLLPSSVPVTLDVVGDGPDGERCRELVTVLGLDHVVTFHGRQPRDAVDAFYQQADVFVFPSYREPGGNVAYEAMAHSLPLIVTDIGGPGAAVDETCGFRIHPIEPTGFAADIAEAIDTLAADSTQRLVMGRAARARVQRIGLWDTKIERIETIYDELASP